MTSRRRASTRSAAASQNRSHLSTIKRAESDADRAASPLRSASTRVDRSSTRFEISAARYARVAPQRPDGKSEMELGFRSQSSGADTSRSAKSPPARADRSAFAPSQKTTLP